MFGAEVLIFEARALGIGGGEHGHQISRGVGDRGAMGGGASGEFGVEQLAQQGEGGACVFDQGQGDSLGLGEERVEKMFVVELGVLAASGAFVGSVEGLAEFFSKAFGIHW